MTTPISEIMLETQRIKTLLEKEYNGAPWHGPTIREALQGISAEEAFHKYESIHSIAELVMHMTAWRQFAIKRLQGDMSFELSESNNWGKVGEQTETQWYYIQNQLESTQEKLCELLDDVEDQHLNDQVHNKGYDFYTLLHGIIQHDIYHIGQIILLKKHLLS
ncbi:MAG TPA: DinB family protein [Cytophagales bacterium]|mgnify:CR=1 FL=1|jgi:uncharacterized damage-inducible protein DinB|nr:DinB family protein [Cytophagales bacterium]